MSAGSGEGRRSFEQNQELGPACGDTRATALGGVTVGREQHEQPWQFGGHWPPDRSVGQLSSHAGSPHSAVSPLTLNVSSARKTTTTKRRTYPSIPQDWPVRVPAAWYEASRP